MTNQKNFRQEGGTKVVIIHLQINITQKKTKKQKHYWSFSHGPATAFTDVLLSPSSLLVFFIWTLAASYQDILIIKGFSSSRLLNRFESIKDEKKQNSTAKLSSNNCRLTLSIHSNTAPT